MNIRRGLQRISALFWGFVATIGVIMSIAIASDFFKTGNMGKTAEVVLIGVALALALGYGGHKAVCWVLAGFAPDGSADRLGR